MGSGGDTARQRPPSANRRQEVRRLRDSATRYSALLEAAPDAFVIADPAGRILLVNGQTESLFGYQPAELVDQPVEILVPERFRERHLGHRAAYAATPRTRPMGTGLELYGRRKDGSEFPVEISLSSLETSDGLLLLSAIRDVTERKRAENKFRSLLEAAPDPMVIVDEQGWIQLVNAQAEQHFGYRREELVGQPVELLVPERFRAEHPRLRGGYFADPRPRPMGAGLRLSARRKDGSEFPAEISLSPIETEDGLLVTAAIRDVSERRALERLQREFVAMVSHELMNPVTGIGLQAELLQLTRTYSETAVKGILTSAHRLERLVGDLLDASRIETGRLQLQPRRSDLLEIARAAVEEVRVGALREVQLQAPATSLVGEWDPVRLEQVIHNLLSNAVKYAPDGEIVVQVERRGRQARVAVSDHGPGIPPDHLPRIFERFYRSAEAERQAQGLGLGLYITRSLVEAHGGRITAESVPGRGSTFRFSLPVKRNGDR